MTVVWRQPHRTDPTTAVWILDPYSQNLVQMDEELSVGAPFRAPSSVQCGARRGQTKSRRLESRRSGEENLIPAMPG